MEEIEVKVLDVNIEEIKRKLTELGGVLVKKEQQENYIYCLPPHLKHQTGYVRIRKTHNLLDNTYNTVLCLKRMISQNEYRKTEEHEVEVLSFDDCRNFIDSMALTFHRQRNKYRESYSFNDTLVEIDIWDKEEFPEPYLEIEANCGSKIFETLDLLGIPREQATSKSLEQIKQLRGIPG